MLKKRVIWIPILCLVSLLMVLLSIDQSTYGRLVGQLIASKTKENGVVLTFTNSELVWLGLKADSVKIGWPRYLLNLEANNFESYLDPSWSLFAEPNVQFRAGILQGQVVGHIIQSGAGPKAAALLMNDLKISDMPQLLAFGVEECFLDSKFELLNSQDFRGEAHIKRCSKPKPSKLSPLLSGIPFEVNLPALTDLDLELTFEKLGTNLTIRQVALQSSLLSATGHGQLSSFGGPLAGIDFSADFNLSAEGTRQLGQYLPLLNLKSEQHRFRLTLKGPVKRPLVSVNPE